MSALSAFVFARTWPIKCKQHTRCNQQLLFYMFNIMYISDTQSMLAAGHQEAAETSVLEASARGVPGALLERCRLLWEREKGHRAVMELQLAVQQMLDSGELCYCYITQL